MTHLSSFFLVLRDLDLSAVCFFAAATTWVFPATRLSQLPSASPSSHTSASEFYDQSILPELSSVWSLASSASHCSPSVGMIHTGASAWTTDSPAAVLWQPWSGNRWTPSSECRLGSAVGPGSLGSGCRKTATNTTTASLWKAKPTSHGLGPMIEWRQAYTRRLFRLTWRKGCRCVFRCLLSQGFDWLR